MRNLLRVLLGYALIWSALARLNPGKLGAAAWSAFLVTGGIAWISKAFSED